MLISQTYPAIQSGGVEFRQVTKRYGGPASPLVIKGVDLIIPKGSLTTILGPSGCGKTTLLRMIAGLETLSAGRVLIDGVDVTELGPAERNVSMVFQSYALFPHMNVLENVAYGLKVASVPPTQRAPRIQRALESVGLLGYENRMPSELSGGQQQRVAVARALVLEPAVMLFDEPLSNLDARLRRSMRDEIRQLQQRLGLTVAYVTHDQSEALAVSDQVVVMDQGRVSQAGTPRQLYEQPRNAFVAGFMGEATLFGGVADGGGSVRVGSLTIQAPADQQPSIGPVKVAIRPEAWKISAQGAAGMSATVVSVAYLGGHQEINLQTELGPILVVTNDAAAQFRVGESLVLNASGRGVSVLADESGINSSA